MMSVSLIKRREVVCTCREEMRITRTEAEMARQTGLDAEFIHAIMDVFADVFDELESK